MQLISNNMRNRLEMGYNTSRDTVGIVIKPSSELGDRNILGLIIPKFMIGYDFKKGDKAQEKSINISKSKKFINDPSIDKFGEDSVIIKNYILVRPLVNQNTEIPKYTIGDRVIVGMIDDDIKTLTFYPYSINRLGQRATDKYFVAVPANKNENVELNEGNTYYFKMDSQNGVLELSTNEENGETTKQTLTFNSKEGIITLTDDKDRIIEINTNDDKITTKTSGASITLTGDVIDIKGDILNIEMESSVNITTDKLNVESNSISSKASDTKYEYDNFKQISQSGAYNIDSEKHDGVSTSFKASTFHVDGPVIGLNGGVVFPAFTIGAVPNINALPPPLSGKSGPKGSTSIETDPMAMPLVKHPPLLSCLQTIAAAADAYPSGAGSASAAVSAFGQLMKTTKMKSS